MMCMEQMRGEGDSAQIHASPLDPKMPWPPTCRHALCRILSLRCVIGFVIVGHFSIQIRHHKCIVVGFGCWKAVEEVME